MNLPADPASDAMMKYAHGVVRTPPHSIGGRHFAQKSGCASDFWQTAHPGTDLLMAAYDCTTGTARSSRRLSHPLPVRTRSALSGRYRYSSMWALLTGGRCTCFSTMQGLADRSHGGEGQDRPSGTDQFTCHHPPPSHVHVHRGAGYYPRGPL